MQLMNVTHVGVGHLSPTLKPSARSSLWESRSSKCWQCGNFLLDEAQILDWQSGHYLQHRDALEYYQS